MGAETHLQPELEQLYVRYLQDHDQAAFLTAAAARYLPAALARLSRHGAAATRRAAVAALAGLGDYEANAALGAALRDSDREVRRLAEDGLAQIWRRDGGEAAEQELRVVSRLIHSGRLVDAVRRAGRLIRAAPGFAEAWRQRGEAYFQLRRWSKAADDFFQTLEMNPYHFEAALRLGHCYLELQDIEAALRQYRRAVTLHPHLEEARLRARRLQRKLRSED